MQNKTLIAVMLVGMAIGMTSCNDGNSTSIRVTNQVIQYQHLVLQNHQFR